MAAASENGVGSEPKDMTQSFDKHFQGAEPEHPTETEEAPKENTSPEFIQFIRERDNLQASLKQKELELYTSQGRNYELLKKIDELELQVKNVKSGGTKTSTPKHGSPVLSHKSLPSLAKKKPATKKSPQKSTTGKKGVAAKPRSKHPHIPGKENLSDDTDAYYNEIAGLYPDLRLSVFLAVQKKFMESDENGDGTIDAEELEKILTNNVVMYTRSECEKILKELDANKTGNLDFLEVVNIVDCLCQNKKTKLPMHLTSQASKSAICSIQ